MLCWNSRNAEMNALGSSHSFYQPLKELLDQQMHIYNQHPFKS